MKTNLFLIDSHALLHRCFHSGTPNLMSPDSEPTKVPFGFVKYIRELFSQFEITHVSAVFDSSKKHLLKKDIFPAYKEGRKETDDDLRIQIKRSYEIANAMGLNVFRKRGYEADDLIAALVKKFKSYCDKITIVTADKDLFQLIDSKVSVFDPFKSYMHTEDDVEQKWGVRAEQVLEVMTLCGDKTDGVDGCFGLGVKTAAKLIKRFGTAEKAKASANLLTPALKKSLLNGDLELNRNLMRLLDDAPIEFEFNDLKSPESLSNEQTRVLFRMLGFRKV